MKASDRRFATYIRGAGRHDAEQNAGGAPDAPAAEPAATLAEAADMAGDLWGSMGPAKTADEEIAQLIAARRAGR